MRNQSIIASSILLLACSGKTLDVGSDATPLEPLPVVPSNPIPEWPDPGECTADSDLEMAGTWDGYIEGTDFEFRLQILSGDSDHLCGTITFGDGPPPPPPTDPDSYYPGVTHNRPGDFPLGGPWSGYAYTPLEGSISGKRVRFLLAMTEGYKEWCALQEPVASHHGYFCSPQGEGWVEGEKCFIIDDLTEEQVEYPCEKIGLCLAGSACVCDDSSCTAAQGSAYGETMNFDFSVSGDEATGTASGAARGPVRLVRAE